MSSHLSGKETAIDLLSPLALIYCAVVLVAAYGLRGSTGFGGVAGMPLLAIVVPMKLLVPVWTLLGIASSLTIVGHDRQHVSLADIGRVLPGCVIGIAIGLYLFTAVDSRTLAQGLGALVLLYGAYSLAATFRAQDLRPAAGPLIAPAAGVIAGAVGTLFGTMASIPFAVYLDARQLAKHRFRATISAMILTLSVIRGVGYFAVGEFDADVWLAFAAALPLMLAGIFLGNRIHTGLSETAFRRVVSAVLIATALPLLFN
jgi:uncharacterized membrane protein YfcA